MGQQATAAVTDAVGDLGLQSTSGVHSSIGSTASNAALVSVLDGVGPDQSNLLHKHLQKLAKKKYRFRHVAVWRQSFLGGTVDHHTIVYEYQPAQRLMSLKMDWGREGLSFTDSPEDPCPYGDIIKRKWCRVSPAQVWVELEKVLDREYDLVRWNCQHFSAYCFERADAAFARGYDDDDMPPRKIATSAEVGATQGKSNQRDVAVAPAHQEAEQDAIEVPADAAAAAAPAAIQAAPEIMLEASSESAPKVLVCPAGHRLEVFATPENGYTCSVCAVVFPIGTNLYGCRQCDYDACSSCSKKSEAGCAAGEKGERNAAAAADAAAPHDVGLVALGDNSLRELPATDMTERLGGSRMSLKRSPTPPDIL